MDDGIEILYIANNPQSTKSLLSRSCSKRKFFKNKTTKEKNTNDQGTSSGYSQDKPPKRPINGSFKAFWEKHDLIDLI